MPPAAFKTASIQMPCPPAITRVVISHIGNVYLWKHHQKKHGIPYTVLASKVTIPELLQS
jgi:hypothetical protein